MEHLSFYSYTTTMVVHMYLSFVLLRSSTLASASAKKTTEEKILYSSYSATRLSQAFSLQQEVLKTSTL
jgi:hypothetical protein